MVLELGFDACFFFVFVCFCLSKAVWVVMGDGVALAGLDPVESRLARVDDETDDELFLVEGFDVSLEL